MSDINEFICIECEKKFKFLKNLRAHIKTNHPLLKLDEIAPTKKQKKSDLYIFTCDQCTKSYCHQKNLIEHKKVAHSITPTIEIIVQCAMCLFTAPYKNMNIHYEIDHNILQSVDSFEFESIDGFNSWKHEIELSTQTLYVKNFGSSEKGNQIYSYYKCHRSGFYNSKSTGQRHIKTQGSNKINGYCPASINVIESKVTKRCNVKFNSNHIGHENEIGHLPLNRCTRDDIASKISQNIPFDRILDEIRDNISNNHLERTHLLTKKDLYNIEASYNLNNEAVHHSNDATSVGAWVEKLKSDDKLSLVYYKSQGQIDTNYIELKEDDFLLLIMNDYQKSMLNKFGNDVICIDETHGMNSYHFNLTTIMVLDDLREGFPCSFMISNRVDEAVLKIFFAEIRDKTGIIQPNVFMSDMAESFYNAWVVEMKPAKHRLYCTWHVDRAWRKNLNKIKNKTKQVEIYKVLRTLLQEQDAEAFSRMFDNAINRMAKDDETMHFSNYFISYYAPSVQSWAYCHRLNSGINTNMHIERMHRTLKHIYLQGKKVKRLDKSLHALMRYTRDKSIDRLIVLHKGKISSKLKELRKRHKTSILMSLEMVLKNVDGKSWNVLSGKTNEMYEVNQLKSNCDCQINCYDCQSCIHCYSCSCIDSTIKWNMCKHIHLVCRFLKKTNDENIKNDENINTNNILTNFKNNIERNNETTIIVSQLNNSTKPSNDLVTEKDKVRLYFNNILDGISSSEELGILKKCLSSVTPTINALRSNSDSQPFKNLTPSHHQTSPNKLKITPQRRFHSTKAKRNVEKSTLNIEVPNQVEQNCIAASLLLDIDQN